MSLTKEQRTYNEGDTPLYSCILKDTAGVVVPLSAITAITMSLHDVGTGTAINSRSAQDVLNKNGCTYAVSSGTFTWQLVKADSAIVNTSEEGKSEAHCAEITFAWATGQQHTHKLTLYVVSLEKQT